MRDSRPQEQHVQSRDSASPWQRASYIYDVGAKASARCRIVHLHGRRASVAAFIGAVAVVAVAVAVAVAVTVVDDQRRTPGTGPI